MNWHLVGYPLVFVLGGFAWAYRVELRSLFDKGYARVQARLKALQD